MKTSSFFILVCIFLFGNSISAHGQRVVYWKGGAPGMKSDWNCPKNWSTGAVPDRFYNVIIPDVSSQSASYPVIEKEAFEVNALTLQSGASLKIGEKGSLTVLTDLETYGTGKIEAKGNLELPGVMVAGNIPQEEYSIIASDYTVKNDQ